MALDDDGIMTEFLKSTIREPGFVRQACKDRVRSLLAQAGTSATARALFHRAYVFDVAANDWVATQWMEDHADAAMAKVGAAGGRD